MVLPSCGAGFRGRGGGRTPVFLFWLGTARLVLRDLSTSRRCTGLILLGMCLATPLGQMQPTGPPRAHSVPQTL